jgi:hypothetical protein
MRRSVRNILGFFAPVLLVVGCREEKAAIPTKLDQPLPKVAGTAGGPPEQAAGDINKNVQPSKAAD